MPATLYDNHVIAATPALMNDIVVMHDYMLGIVVNCGPIDHNVVAAQVNVVVAQVNVPSSIDHVGAVVDHIGTVVDHIGTVVNNVVPARFNIDRVGDWGAIILDRRRPHD